jgi:uncharacterized membrane protein
MAAFALISAIAFAALSIDAGRLWLERRSVQRAADMAALSASRFIGCGTDIKDAQAAALEVATAQGITKDQVSVQYGKLARGANNALVFTAGGTSETADAVQVTLNKSVRRSLLLGALASEMVLIPATSAAKGHAPVASFAINSVYGVNQDIAEVTSGLFGAILGTTGLTLDADDLESLMKETVSLADLMDAAPRIAKVEDLLDQQVNLQTLLNRIAGANPNIAGNTAFQKIRDASAKKTNIVITLGDVISVYRPVSIGIKEAKINALDLLLTGVQVNGATESQAAKAAKRTGVFNFGVRGLFTFTVDLLNAPKLALGSAGRGRNGEWCTTAQSSQISTQVGIDLRWLLGAADMVLRMDAGTVEGHLTKVAINPTGIVGDVAAQSATVTLVLTNNNDANNPIIPDTFGPAKILAGLVEVKIYQPILAAKSVSTEFQAQSKYDLPTAIRLGGGTAGQSVAGLLGDKSVIEVKALWGLIKLRVDFLDDLVTFVMAPLGALLDGLLALFGIQTGNAYLQMRTIEMMPPTLVN